MKDKTDTYIFRTVQSIQCETFNIFRRRKAEEMRNHNNKQHFFYLHFSDVVTLSCDNTLIFIYFTQNLLENWILGGNLVVDKTLRKLRIRKATTSGDNEICYNCYLLLFEQGKGCKIQSLSADQRGQRQNKNPHNNETKRKKSGKKSCVSSSFMSLV